MRINVLRAVVVAAQAATIWITWPLWQARATPPLLPIIAVPQLSFGWALLASLCVALRWARLGAGLHAVLLLSAIVCDQTREQPQVLSLALLLWSTSAARGARTIGVLHLVALWFWSGVGKLTSPRFLGEGGAWLLGGVVAPGSTSSVLAAALLGAAEGTLALLALVPATRANARWLASALHAGILLYLALLRDGNPSVWPWNAALAVAAPVLLGDCAGTARAWWAHEGRALRLAAVLFVLLPLGHLAGFVDAAFSHQVYAQNGPRGLLLRRDGSTERLAELPGLRVFLPPVPRVFAAWFERCGEQGDRLAILEERWLARALGAHDSMVSSEGADYP